jgi:hypothetical protein
VRGYCSYAHQSVDAWKRKRHHRLATAATFIVRPRILREFAMVLKVATEDGWFLTFQVGEVCEVGQVFCALFIVSFCVRQRSA